MKKLERVQENIAKELKLSLVERYGSTEVDIFIEQAQRYVKAIKEGRMICNIESVSKSGMSRTLKFLECSGSIKEGFNYLTFYNLFKTLSFKKGRNSYGFRIGGCGMDMVFNTNYTIIHRLTNLGLVSKKECEVLAQRTPTVA
jgi:hypothetical protein